MHPIESLRDEPLSRLGPLPVHAVRPGDPLRQAIRIMQEHRVGCILVCEGNRPTGVVTERDILRRMGASLSLDVPVSEVTLGRIWAVRLSDSVETALRMMNRYQCRHLVVVNDQGDAAGVLSVKRIVRTLVEHFPSSVYNLPPVSKQVHTDAEGA